MKIIPSPPKNIKSLTLLERDLIFNSIQDEDEEGLQWLEKLRKFTSFHNRNLKKVSKVKFKEQSNNHLLWLREIFINKITQNQNQNLKIDASIINAALIANDACPNDQAYNEQLESILSDLRSMMD